MPWSGLYCADQELAFYAITIDCSAELQRRCLNLQRPTFNVSQLRVACLDLGLGLLLQCGRGTVLLWWWGRRGRRCARVLTATTTALWQPHSTTSIPLHPFQGLIHWSLGLDHQWPQEWTRLAFVRWRWREGKTNRANYVIVGPIYFVVTWVDVGWKRMWAQRLKLMHTRNIIDLVWAASKPPSARQPDSTWSVTSSSNTKLSKTRYILWSWVGLCAIFQCHTYCHTCM